MTIEIQSLTKRFRAGRPGTPALDAVDLSIADGEFLALLGPSGSGKTTLLRIIAGLEQADSGSLAIGGIEATHLSARERRIGFVFQQYALFRHMSVADNIAFGLRVRSFRRRPPRAEIRTRVSELLELVQLGGMEDRFPRQLSGGQRQRVALARALAVEPRLLLLDEPFGALDAKVRAELRDWLRALHDRLSVTTVFVTHDQDEALALADRIAILNRGRVEQIGSPAAVYDRPASPFVFEFLGTYNRFRGEARDATIRLTDGTPVTVEPGTSGGPVHGGSARNEPVRDEPVRDGPVVVYVRPHDVLFCRAAEGVTAVVRTMSVSGPRTRLVLDREDQTIEMEADRETVAALALAPGSPVRIGFRRVHAFPA